MKELDRVEIETRDHLESLKEVDFHNEVDEVLNNMDLFAEVYPDLPDDTLEALFNYMNGNESNLPTIVYNAVYEHVGGKL